MYRRGNPAFLGEHFASRDPAHIARWLEAMRAGRARRQCVAIARSTGEQCRRHSLKFSDKCTIHCIGAERIAVDEKRFEWLKRRRLKNFNAVASVDRRARNNAPAHVQRSSARAVKASASTPATDRSHSHTR